MFAFEVEELRRRRHEAKSKEEDDMDDFIEWSRWKKGRLQPGAAVPPVAAQPQEPRFAVNNEPKGKEPAVSVEEQGAGFQVVPPLSSAGKELAREAVFALLADELTVGEDDDFEKTMERVSKAEAVPVRTWEELLRLAVLYHQVVLHFSGPAVAPVAEQGQKAVEMLKGHPLGGFVEVMRQTLEHSYAWGASSGQERLKHVEALRQLIVQHGGDNYFPRYVFGIRNWKRLGDMAQLVLVVQTYQGNEKKKIVADPAYCPSSVASWMAYRLGMHNYRVVKRTLSNVKPRKRADELRAVRRMLERAKVLDTDGVAARQAADKALEDLSAFQDSLDPKRKD